MQKQQMTTAAQEQRAETDRIANEAATEYTKRLSVTVSPGLADEADLIEQVRHEPMLYDHAEGDLICRCRKASAMNWDAEAENHGLPEACTAYVAFLDRSGKHIIEVGDAYPQGTPPEDTVRHMRFVMQNIAQGAGDSCIWSIEIAARAQAMSDAAQIGVHTIGTEAVDQILDEAEAAGLPPGGKVLILEGIADYDSNIMTLLTQGGRHHEVTDGRMCSRRAAGRIIRTARQEGLDAYQLAELAKTMGFSPREVSANPRRLRTVDRHLIELAAINGGLDEDTVDRIMDNIESVQE